MSWVIGSAGTAAQGEQQAAWPCVELAMRIGATSAQRIKQCHRGKSRKMETGEIDAMDGSGHEAHLS